MSPTPRGKTFRFTLFSILTAITLMSCQFGERALAIFASATPTATNTPTYTPTPVYTPTPTKVPIPTVAAGWKHFEGDGFTINLPDSYIGGSGETDMQIIADFYENLGNSERAQQIQQSADQFRLLAIDTNPDDVLPGTTNLTVLLQESVLLSALPLDQFATVFSEQFNAEYGIETTDQRAFEHSNLDGYRMTFSGDLSEIAGVEIDEEFTASLVMYLLRGEGRLWVLTFTTLTDDLEERLGEFDMAVSSFREDH